MLPIVKKKWFAGLSFFFSPFKKSSSYFQSQERQFFFNTKKEIATAGCSLTLSVPFKIPASGYAINFPPFSSGVGF